MRIFPWFIAPVVALFAACTPDVMPQPDEGAALFAKNCSTCHGPRAKGGKQLARGKVAPDLTRIAFRNGGTFPEAQVLSQIDGYGRGKAGEVMPEFGSLLEGETVPVDIDGTLTPTPRPLAALLAYLESVQTP